jgi:hypothetical protein
MIVDLEERLRAWRSENFACRRRWPQETLSRSRELLNLLDQIVCRQESENLAVAFTRTGLAGSAVAAVSVRWHMRAFVREIRDTVWRTELRVAQLPHSESGVALPDNIAVKVGQRARVLLESSRQPEDDIRREYYRAEHYHGVRFERPLFDAARIARKWAQIYAPDPRSPWESNDGDPKAFGRWVAEQLQRLSVTYDMATDEVFKDTLAKRTGIEKVAQMGINRRTLVNVVAGRGKHQKETVDAINGFFAQFTRL